MIRIIKSTPPPVQLTTAGTAHRTQLEAEYDTNPAAYQNGGTGKLAVRSDIYGHASVKAQLMQDQYEKCCYCEARFTANGYGDVEHFRPKAGYQQRTTDKLQKPGYYWLAYDWNNLFFSCQICNQKHKKNHFPLVNDPAGRAHNHHDDVTQEQPLLPDLAREDPAQSLTFRAEVAFGTDARGKKAITIYGLNRLKIVDARREHLEKVKLNRFLAALDLSIMLPPELATTLQTLQMTKAEAQHLIDTARQFLAQAAGNAAPYAGMVRAAFPALPR